MPLACDIADLPLSSVMLDPGTGSVTVPVLVSCEGIYIYPGPDGTIIRELVTRDAIEQQAAALDRAPVTVEHPAESVTPETWSSLAVGDAAPGAVGEELIDGIRRVAYRAPVTVRSARALDRMRQVRAEGGQVFISPAYTPIREVRAGTDPRFGAYDRVRTGIDPEHGGNHIALLFDSAPRGGPACRVEFDSLPPEWGSLAPPPAAQETDSMDPSALYDALIALLADPEKGPALAAALDACRTVPPADGAGAAMPEGLPEQVAAMDSRVKALEDARTARDAADKIANDAAEATRLTAIGTHFGMRGTVTRTSLLAHLRVKGVGLASDSDDVVLRIAADRMTRGAQTATATDSTTHRAPLAF